MVTRPFVEAFFHARYFLAMAVKYGRELEFPPALMPSGWAAVLYLFDLREGRMAGSRETMKRRGLGPNQRIWMSRRIMNIVLDIRDVIGPDRSGTPPGHRRLGAVCKKLQGLAMRLSAERGPRSLARGGSAGSRST
jgi:hypothetical protein